MKVYHICGIVIDKHTKLSVGNYSYNIISDSEIYAISRTMELETKPNSMYKPQKPGLVLCMGDESIVDSLTEQGYIFFK